MRTKGAISLQSIKVRDLKPLINSLPDNVYVTVGAQWFKSLTRPEFAVITPSAIAKATKATKTKEQNEKPSKRV